MQFTIKGELTIAELKQAILEQMNIMEEQFGVRHSLGATIFIHPTNGFGDAVSPRDKHGVPMKKEFITGPYRSAAEEFKIR
jgi:hypothetical protein